MAVGIDIGTVQTRIAVVERKGSAYSVAGYARIPTAEVLGQPARLQEALEAAGATRGSATVSVSGRDVILKISNYPSNVPEWRLRLLIDYEVGELAERAGGDILSGFRLLDVPGRAGNERTALLALAKEGFVEERIGLVEGAGQKLEAAIPAPVAIGNAYAATLDAASVGHSALVIDIGATTTDVALLADRKLIFARNANFGGEAFVQAVAETFSIKPHTAARMIREEGALPGTPGADASTKASKLARALSGPAGDLGSLVRSSVKFCQAQLRSGELQIDEIVLSGGVAPLRGLAEDIGQTVRLPARVLDLSSLAGSSLTAESLAAFQGDGPAAATAVGLGVTSAGKGKDVVSLELLPERFERRRRFLHEQLFVLLGAGLAFLAAMLLWATLSNNRDVEEARAKALRAEADELYALQESLEAALNAREEMIETRSSWATVVEPAMAFTEAFAAIRRAVPQDVYLESVSLEPRASYRANPKIVVKGKIRESTQSVSAIYKSFKDKLETLPGFEFKTENLAQDDFTCELLYVGESTESN